MDENAATGLLPAQCGPHDNLALFSYWRARWGPLRRIGIVVLLFNLLFNLPFWFLHEHGLMLPEFCLRAPYHFEPRFAHRHYLLATSPGADVIFTGDSRVEMGINPDLLQSISAFNFAVGSQTIPMTEKIVLDSLSKLNKKPRFLVLGITPDYMSASGIRDSSTAYFIAAYQKAEQHHEHEPILRTLRERFTPVLFYRDTVFRDLRRLLPALTQSSPPREIEGGLPLVAAVTWKEYLAMSFMPMTSKGYNLDDMAIYVKGDYPRSQGIRPRLRPPYQPDREALADLVHKIRDQGIEPLFVIMPFHDSFFAQAFHPGVRELLADAVRDVAQNADVLLLHVPFDTTNSADYWDAHHMSTQGATTYSRVLETEFATLIKSGDLDRRYNQRFGPRPDKIKTS